MHTRTIGIVLLGAAVVFLTLTYLFKMQEDYHLQQVTLEGGSCFVNGECIYEKRNFTIYIISGVVSALALILGIYLTFFDRKTEPLVVGATISPAKEVDIKELNEEEQRIYQFVKEHKGSAFQSDVVRELGLSKVRVTRILDRLEGLGLVERKRRGMTNIIVLK